MSFLYLRISGPNLNFSKIRETLNLSSTVFMGKKGEKMQKEYYCEEDFLQYQLEIKNNKVLDEEIECFVNQLYQHKEFFWGLSRNNESIIYLVLYPEEIQTNVYLSNQVLEKLQCMNLSISFSYMLLGRIDECK